MPEILAQRVGDRVLVPDQQADGAVEPFDALLGAWRAVLHMRLPLAFQHLAHPRFGGVGLHGSGLGGAHGVSPGLDSVTFCQIKQPLAARSNPALNAFLTSQLQQSASTTWSASDRAGVGRVERQRARASIGENSARPDGRARRRAHARRITSSSMPMPRAKTRRRAHHRRHDRRPQRRSRRRCWTICASASSARRASKKRSRKPAPASPMR